LLSSSIVPGVEIGGGFVSGVQGDAVFAGPKSGFSPDALGRPSGGLGTIPRRDCADDCAVRAVLSGRADAAGVLAITRPATAARHEAPPASTADRCLNDIKDLHVFVWNYLVAQASHHIMILRR
jgi:hypothetical protein